MSVPDEYQWFTEQVFRTLNIDLNKYKRGQMERRLIALRTKYGCPDFYAFFEGMVQSKEIQDAFLDRMTINVSEFFRNANRWDVLRQRILPEFCQRGKPVEIWSAACSTGEEPYSLALLACGMNPQVEVSILATDIDETALARAQEGIYPDKALHDLPAGLLERYFTRSGEGRYQISRELLKRITFKKANLLEDSFGVDFDLIVCRNVLIYFQEQAKDMLYHKFSTALRPGGILFVGSTEQIFNPGRFNFSVYDTFFYQKV
ncbi:MAG: chemotaxis protein CheR [Bacilli bacterium]|nr:chemotaxis protein CheR [Bacilli bacterium]